MICPTRTSYMGARVIFWGKFFIFLKNDLNICGLVL